MYYIDFNININSTRTDRFLFLKFIFLNKLVKIEEKVERTHFVGSSSEHSEKIIQRQSALSVQHFLGILWVL